MADVDTNPLNITRYDVSIECNVIVAIRRIKSVGFTYLCS